MVHTFWLLKYLNFGQKLPIWAAHYTFLESRHPEVTKNPYYILPHKENQKRALAHGLMCIFMYCLLNGFFEFSIFRFVFQFHFFCIQIIYTTFCLLETTLDIVKNLNKKNVIEGKMCHRINLMTKQAIDAFSGMFITSFWSFMLCYFM